MTDYTHVVITAKGLCCALGLDADNACAAAHAGLSRAKYLDYEVFDSKDLESVPVAGHSVPIITEGFKGIGRMQQMLEAAILDLTAKLPIAEYSKTAFSFLVSADFYHKMSFEKRLSKIDDPAEIQEEIKDKSNEIQQYRAAVKNQLIPSILELANLPLAEKNQFLYFGGPAQFVKVLNEAANLIESQQYEHVIVGSAESLVEHGQLDILQELGVLKTPDNPVGFMPGEAASFICLSNRNSVKPTNIMANLTAVSDIEKDAAYFENTPSTGKAMCDALVSVADKNNPYLAYCININGTEYRATDIGIAKVRLVGKEVSNHFDITTPVESFGEIGVATGPAMLCYAIHGIVRDPTRTRKMQNGVVVGLYSDDGARGAFRIN